MKQFNIQSLGYLLLIITLNNACHEQEKIKPEHRNNLYSAYAKGKVDIEGGLIKLASSKDGLITVVNVEDGDVVKQGAILAIVDDREAKLKLAVTEAEVNEARSMLTTIELKQHSVKRDLDRLDRLLKQDAVALVQWEQADDLVKQLNAEKLQLEARIHLTEAHRDSDLLELDQRKIRAPLDGRIVKRLARLGDGVSTQTVTTLFLFEPISPRIVRAELDEHFTEGIHSGDAAEIILEADESKVFVGKVLRIGQVYGLQQLTGDSNEKADQRVVECVVGMDDQSLRIGQRVLVRISNKSK